MIMLTTVICIYLLHIFFIFQTPGVRLQNALQFYICLVTTCLKCNRCTVINTVNSLKFSYIRPTHFDFSKANLHDSLNIKRPSFVALSSTCLTNTHLVSGFQITRSRFQGLSSQQESTVPNYLHVTQFFTSSSFCSLQTKHSTLFCFTMNAFHLPATKTGTKPTSHIRTIGFGFGTVTMAYHNSQGYQQNNRVLFMADVIARHLLIYHSRPANGFITRVKIPMLKGFIIGWNCCRILAGKQRPCLLL